MPNLICELEHGTPDHDNLRTPAARDLLPGELDFNPTTGAVMIADRGAKLGKESAAVVQNGRAVFRIKNPAYNPARDLAPIATVASYFTLFLVNPQVNVGVEEFAKRLVTVLGEVQKGGTFEFPNQGPLDLLQAIGLAGGYSKVANPGKIVVKRRVDGKETVLLVNGKALAAKAGAERFEVFPGDTITVAQSIF